MENKTLKLLMTITIGLSFACSEESATNFTSTPATGVLPPASSPGTSGGKLLVEEDDYKIETIDVSDIINSADAIAAEAFEEKKEEEKEEETPAAPVTSAYDEDDDYDDHVEYPDEIAENEEDKEEEKESENPDPMPAVMPEVASSDAPAPLVTGDSCHPDEGCAEALNKCLEEFGLSDSSRHIVIKLPITGRNINNKVLLADVSHSDLLEGDQVRVVYVKLDAYNVNKSSMTLTAPNTYYCVDSKVKNANGFSIEGFANHVQLVMEYKHSGHHKKGNLVSKILAGLK